MPNKIFVIGLPRTGTTSLCATMLELGFTTAHTAYTKQTIADAQVIADTPIFCDFEKLAFDYPDAQFIYLTRSLEPWLPSIKQLLNRMFINVTREDGGFNPHIKRCYQTIFSPFTLENINDDNFLGHCYLAHQQSIQHFFTQQHPQYTNRLLTIDISNADDMKRLANFLCLPMPDREFFHLNKGGKVTAWKDIKHPLKVESTHNGRIDKAIY
ncbi:sulfotransferase [Thalassotalea fusca]